MVWLKTPSGDLYWQPTEGDIWQEWGWNDPSLNPDEYLIWDKTTASPVDSFGKVISNPDGTIPEISTGTTAKDRIAGTYAKLAKTAKAGAGGWPLAGISTATFLLGYEMEAVSFTEFIYYEGVRWGIKFLKMIKAHEDYKLLEYFSFKFYYNIWQGAWGFHIIYGPLNPFTNNAYGVMYEYYWKEYLSIVKIVPEVPKNFDAGKWLTDNAYRMAVAVQNAEFYEAQIWWPSMWPSLFTED